MGGDPVEGGAEHMQRSRSKIMRVRVYAVYEYFLVPVSDCKLADRLIVIFQNFISKLDSISKTKDRNYVNLVCVLDWISLRAIKIMSNLPAWKRALLEKKKQHEQEEEVKKQQERDAYIKSLPPWKRAIVLRDLEKNKASSTTSASQPTGNAPTSTSAQPQDKWKAALSQSNKSSASESPARNRVAWGGSGGGVRGLVSNQNNAESGRPSWVREKSPTPPTADPSPTAQGDSSEDTSSPKIVTREQRRGSVQLLKDHFKASSPPPSMRSLQQKESKSVPQTVKREVSPPQQQATKSPSPQPTQTMPAPTTAPAVIQVDDSDLAGLPSWKRALILKKRQKQAGLVPGASTQPPQSGSTDKTSELSKASEPPPETPKSPNVTKKESTTKPRPDVVNRANESDNPGSNKLVQKEGVSLHPPIFNEVGQWANVAADDPKFTQLPQWKQALILRRRKDIAKRSGQETSPPDSPTVKTAAEKRRASSPSSSSQATETKKGGSKKSLGKSTGKTEGKKTTKTKATEDKKTTTSKSSNKSKAKSGEEKSTKTVKANANKAKTTSTAGKHGSGGIKPVRSAPTKPPEKKQVEKEKEEEKEEPMFTWNFSKNSMDTGDAMSNSSDSELEDVQITSIDDELTDEDDSGIGGGGGGTILKSYKPLADTSEIEERSVTPENRERSVTPEKNMNSLAPPQRAMSNSTSDPTINKIPRSESKPILIDPAKKTYKVSKVSPSCPLLVQE